MDVLVKGWLVYPTDEGGTANSRFFLDLNNVLAYCERRCREQTFSVQPQYMRKECAADLHKSRLRRDKSRREPDIPWHGHRQTVGLER